MYIVIYILFTLINILVEGLHRYQKDDKEFIDSKVG